MRDLAIELLIAAVIALYLLGGVLAAYCISEARLKPTPRAKWAFILLWPIVMLDTISGGLGGALVNRLRNI